MKLKRLRSAIIVTAVTGAMITTPVFAAPSVDDLESGKAQTQGEVSSLQTELVNLLDKMGQLEEDLISKGEQITKAQSDLTAAEEKEKEQYDAMKIRIKYMYENGDTTALETLITAKDFTDLVNKAEYVQNVHTYDRKKLEEYVETKQQITDLKTTLEEDQANLETMQTEYEAEEDTLNTTIETKQAEIANFDQELQAAAAAAAQEAAARAAAAAGTSDTASGSGQSAGTGSTNGGGGSSTGSGGSTGGGSGSTGGGGSTGNSGGSGSGGTSSGNTSTAQAIVNAAYSQLGVPYVWGGTTPYGGLDCSGLVQYCHAAAGISLPRTSQAQGGSGVAVSSPEPGDMVCYGTHIGIYIGGGMMIHSPKPGDVVKVASVYGSPWYRRCW